VVPLTGEKGEFSSLRITEEDLEAMLRFGQGIESILPKLINGLTPLSSRGICARLLMLMGPLATPALPQLILLLRDKAAAGTGTIQQIVATIGSKALPLLLEMLREKDVQVRNRAIETLGMMGFRAKRAVPNLIDKLKNGSPSERIVAANALGGIGPAAASAVPALKAALKDRDLALIWSAVFCLKGMRARAEPAILDLLQLLDIPSLSAVMKCQMMWCLGSIGSASTPALISCLKNRDAVVRANAAGQLGQCGSRSQDAVPALTESLLDQDAGVRAAAAAALGRIGPEARCAEPELRRLLDDWCDIVRRNVQEALAAIEAARSSQARIASEA
jgi:HEAT repeat protein